MDSKSYHHRSTSSHKSKDRDRDRDRDRSRSRNRARRRERSDSGDSRDEDIDSRRGKERVSHRSTSRDRDRGRDRDRDRKRDRSSERGRGRELGLERTKSESDPLPPGKEKENKDKTGGKPNPPVSKQDVEDCMDQLEMTMEKSRKSQEEKILKLEGVNPTKDEVSTNILIDYRRGGNDHFLGARFLFECGIKLELKPTTIATAAFLYHKFWDKTDTKTYDVCTIGATSILIACKVENEKRRMRDLINVVHQSIERDAELLDMDEKYFVYKNGIVQAELFMMRILEFQVTYDHPHRYLVHYLRELQNWIGYEAVSSQPIFRTAWSILQDFYHDPSILKYKPQELAVAALDTALSAFGAIIPGDKPKAKKNWKTVFYFKFNEDTNREIIMKMFEIYDKEAEYIPALVYDKSRVQQTLASSTADINKSAISTGKGVSSRNSQPGGVSIPERENAMMSGMNPVPPPPPKLFHN